MAPEAQVIRICTEWEGWGVNWTNYKGQQFPKVHLRAANWTSFSRFCRVCPHSASVLPGMWLMLQVFLHIYHFLLMSVFIQGWFWVFLASGGVNYSLVLILRLQELSGIKRRVTNETEQKHFQPHLKEIFALSFLHLLCFSWKQTQTKSFPPSTRNKVRRFLLLYLCWWPITS